MRKRFFALLMALVMVFSLNTTFLADVTEPAGSATVDNTVELPTEVNVEWNYDWSFTLNHVGVDGTRANFEFTLYKDGVEVESFTDFWWNSTTWNYAGFRDDIDETAEYQVKVTATYTYEDEDKEGFTITGETEKVKYTRPDKVLATPVVKYEDGIVSFDPVEGASYYYILVYENTLEGSSYVNTVPARLNNGRYELNLKDYMKGRSYEADLYCSAIAKTNDINVVLDSAESAKVGPYEYRVTKKDASVTWSAEEIGTIKISKISDEATRISYGLTIYKDDVEVGFTNVYGYANEDISENISYIFEEFGSGTYTVKAKGSQVIGEETIVYIGEAAYTYAAANKLATPTNIKITENKVSDKKSTYTLTFDAVDGANSYGVYWRTENLTKGTAEEWLREYVYVEDGEKSGSIDVTYMIEELEWYKEDLQDWKISIGVRALTDDYKNLSTSEAAYVVALEKKTTAEEAEKALDEALENILENPKGAQSVLANTSNDILVAKMQDSKFLEKVKKAEAAYVEEMQIVVKDPVSTVASVDASKITIIGAGLNAGMFDEVQLTIAKPEKEVTVPEKYKKGIQLDINLLIDGKSIEELKVPVTITMPIPEGISTDDLVILHYHGDATEPVVITPVVSEDGKMMTFTVSGFSTFVVTNVAKAPDTGDNSVAVVCAMMLVAVAAGVVFKKRVAR